MKSSLLVSAGITALLVMGCTKETGSELQINSVEGNRNIVMSTISNPMCDMISFSNATGLLSSVTSDGGLGPITMTSKNFNTPGQPVAAMVFNSAAPHWEDVDLGTPNQVFMGPGIGAGGESGTYVNNKPLGNIVVIQNFNQFGLEPNDDDGLGYITFDFSNVGKVTVNSLTVMDVETAREGEGGTIKLYDKEGGTLLYTAELPDTEANGVGVVDLKGTKGVGFIRIDLNGSIGIDNLSFCRERYAPCTYTQGYWKNHPEAWPVSNLKLGNVNYTQSQLLSILRQPVRGNGLVSLAHQLIAAKLNAANGANFSVIAADITAADAMIGNLVVPPVGSGNLAPSVTSSLNDRLDKYNNGVIGPGHCK